MNIVAVDDEYLGLECLLTAIHKAAPQEDVQGFRNGNVALDYMRIHQPDVVFLDIELRSADGISLAEELGRLYPGVKIIFATGYRKYKEKAETMNVSGYIMKPITPEEVEQVLAHL